MAKPLYEFDFLKIIQEEEITDIPKNINSKIGYAKMMLTKYEKKPSPAMLEALKNADNSVVEAIEAYVESHTDEQEKHSETKSIAPVIEKEIPQEPVLKSIEVEQPKDKETLIREEIADNMISSNKLKSILGKLDAWNGIERVGSLTLVKVAFQPYYRLS